MQGYAHQIPELRARCLMASLARLIADCLGTAPVAISPRSRRGCLPLSRLHNGPSPANSIGVILRPPRDSAAKRRKGDRQSKKAALSGGKIEICVAGIIRRNKCRVNFLLILRADFFCAVTSRLRLSSAAQVILSMDFLTACVYAGVYLRTHVLIC
jgi:hypothetical protein